MSEAICHKCSAPLDIKVGHKAHRSDTCDSCNTDIKCCKNCVHYSLGAYNQCKENQAERVVDKERANFCDFFNMRGATASHNQQTLKQDQKAKLDDLFKR